MNTSKQINAMIVMLLLLLLGVGIYTIWDPFRATAETDRTRERLAEYAAARFARNCRQCHGNEGEGRLGLGPALNPEFRENAGLPSFTDPTKIDENQRLVLNTINCGRIGTLMPAWAQEQGGNLSIEQIRQLVLLITNPPADGWHKVAELSAEENATIPLTPVEEIQNGSPITGAASRVCGQRAPATPPPDTGPVRVQTQWNIVATDNRFDVAAMGVPPGQQVTVTMQNNGQALHNWAVQNVTSSTGQAIKTDIVPGGRSASVTFTIPNTGNFTFICDVHPTEMRGRFVVQATDAAGAATPTATGTPAAGATPAAGGTATPTAAVTTTPVAGSPSPTASPSPSPSPSPQP